MDFDVATSRLHAFCESYVSPSKKAPSTERLSNALRSRLTVVSVNCFVFINIVNLFGGTIEKIFLIRNQNQKTKENAKAEN